MLIFRIALIVLLGLAFAFRSLFWAGNALLPRDHFASYSDYRNAIGVASFVLFPLSLLSSAAIVLRVLPLKKRARVSTTEEFSEEVLKAVASGTATPEENRRVFIASMNDKELSWRLVLMSRPGTENTEITKATTETDEDANE